MFRALSSLLVYACIHFEKNYIPVDPTSCKSKAYFVILFTKTINSAVDIVCPCKSIYETVNVAWLTGQTDVLCLIKF